MQVGKITNFTQMSDTTLKKQRKAVGEPEAQPPAVPVDVSDISLKEAVKLPSNETFQKNTDALPDSAAPQPDLKKSSHKSEKAIHDKTANRAPATLFMEDAAEPSSLRDKQSLIDTKPVFTYELDMTDIVVAEAISIGKNIPKRWSVTPKIENSHREDVKNFTLADFRKEYENNFQSQFMNKAISKRYGDREGMLVVELGPAYFTTIAEALKDKDNQYIGMDMSEPYMEKQREFLNEIPGMKAEFSQALGDTYNLPIKPGKADLVVTSCHPPFVSASVEDQKLAIDSVCSILKPGGEFAVYPWEFSKHQDEVNDHLFKKFDMVETHRLITHFHNKDEVENLLILKKKDEE